MSLNLYNATTGTLKNVAGDIINTQSVNEMLAPVEEGATASKAYSAGEQFIIDNVLYYAMTNIAQGEAFDYDVNYYEASPLTEQVDDKQNKTDLGLQTDSKTVVGAINELNDKVTPYVPSSLESATWAEISKSIEDGTLTQYAHIGDTKSFEMNGKTYHAEIVSINDGTGDAGQWYPDKTVDFICTELYETAYPYYTEQAAVGGFPNTELKETLVSTLYPLLPSDLKDIIVGKTHAYNTGGGTNTATTDLWLPTHYEITGSVDMFAPEETALNNKAYTLTSKIKNLNGQSSAIAWWLGSTANNYAYYWKVLANGNLRDDDGYLSIGVPICFRVGGDGSSLIPAKQVSYDNTGTSLSSTDVQGAIAELNNDLTDYSVNTPLRNVTYYNGKLYQITSTGQKGSEISMSRLLDYSHSVELNPTTRSAISYTTPSDGILIVSTRVITGDDRSIYINNKPVFILADINIGYQGTIEGIPKGSVIKTIGQLFEDTTGQARHLTFVPYK